MSHTPEILKIQKENPFMSVTKIAAQIGVSKQAVWDVLKRYHLPTRIVPLQQLFPCKSCGTLSEKMFCSKECKRKYYYREITCETCGKKKFVLKIRSGGRFCSNECHGKWLGDTYGKYGRRPRIYDYKKIAELMKNKTSYLEMSKILGVPVKTLYSVTYEIRVKSKEI